MTQLTQRLDIKRSSYTMPTILWLILALIVASILLVIITEIVNSIRLKNELPTLWEHIKPLERFTRPNS